MEIDIAKRRRVMQRSQQLGHCICDPRRPCPCDVFTDQGICPCAGERPDSIAAADVKLTEMVHNAGCASKIAPADLEAVLSRLPAVDDAAVISGLPAADDAGIYRISDDLCIVQTVDVMTPCVDDAHTFGRICAANCLSDIYAMGGVPRTALSVIAFPSETLGGEIMRQMMLGAMEVLAEANVALIGGHSIKDEEIKLGFAITGTIDADDAVRHETAHVGDVLVLTKPLGAGVLAFSRQIGQGDGDSFAAATASMATLNKDAAEAMTEAGASACTDVTGFGLFGHLIGMARKSQVTCQVYADAMPAFDGAVDALRAGVVPGAIERNGEYVGDDLVVDDGVDEAMAHLGLDAQTSGGLLIAVPEDRHDALMQSLADRGVQGATIGRITEQSSGRIVLTPTSAPAAISIPEPAATTSGAEKVEAHDPNCCADVFGQPADAATTEEAKRAFGALMRASGAAGDIDARTKELINFALVVLSRCAPCLAAHLNKARKMGITQAELDEAVWCAVAMGGAPVKMFYEESLARLDAHGGEDCCQQT